jgi:hypothetical protein
VRTSDLIRNERLEGRKQSSNGKFVLAGRNVTGQKLLQVDLEFQSMAKCSEVLTKLVDPQQLQKHLSVGLLEDSMLCAGELAGGKDSCQVRCYSTLTKIYE